MKKIITISLFAFLLFSFGTVVALPTAYIQNGGGNNGNNNNLGNLYNFTASNSMISKDDLGENSKNDVDAIPEPASLILLGLGLVGAGFLRRHK